jgi:hypothetical protein
MSTSPSRRLSRRLFPPLAVVVVVVVAACSSAAAPQLAPVGGPVDNLDAQSNAGDAFRAAAPAASAAAAAGDGSTDQTGGVPQTDVSRPDLLIIKTGTMALEVQAIDGALAAGSDRIASLGGYVSGSERKGDGEQASASVTYRIPAGQWDAALSALRGLADKVLGEQTQSQDVTGDVADLGARIANLKATELALQAIMAKATKIDDVLAVEAQLSSVQGQIEQLTTQQQHLQGQAAFSTLTVTFSLKPLPAVVTSQQQLDPGTEVDRASANLVSILQGLATAGIWFVIVWLPILILLALLLAIAAFVIRRLRPGSGTGGGPLLPPEPPEPLATEA